MDRDTSTLGSPFEADTQDQGCPHMRARESCEQCDREAEVDAEFVAKLRRVAGHLATAESFARQALKDMEWLNAVDIELGEGDGPDAKAALAAAGSALRNAERIINARVALLES